MTERDYEMDDALDDAVEAGIMDRTFEHGDWRYRLTDKGRALVDGMTDLESLHRNSREESDDES